MSAGKAGRPRAAKSIERDLVDVPPSRCRVCNSTRRADYEHVQLIEGAGTDPQGRPYTAVELRPTRCLDCEQARMDRTWIYVPGEIGETD